jgi:hypothetical protein
VKLQVTETREHNFTLGDCGVCSDIGPTLGGTSPGLDLGFAPVSLLSKWRSLAPRPSTIRRQSGKNTDFAGPKLLSKCPIVFLLMIFASSGHNEDLTRQ